MLRMIFFTLQLSVKSGRLLQFTAGLLIKTNHLLVLLLSFAFVCVSCTLWAVLSLCIFHSKPE